MTVQNNEGYVIVIVIQGLLVINCTGENQTECLVEVKL